MNTALKFVWYNFTTFLSKQKLNMVLYSNKEYPFPYLETNNTTQEDLNDFLHPKRDIDTAYDIAKKYLGIPYKSRKNYGYNSFDCFNYTCEVSKEIGNYIPSRKMTLRDLFYLSVLNNVIHPCHSIDNIRKNLNPQESTYGHFLLKKIFSPQGQEKFHTGLYFSFPSYTVFLQNRDSTQLPNGFQNRSTHAVIENTLSVTDTNVLLEFWNSAKSLPNRKIVTYACFI